MSPSFYICPETLKPRPINFREILKLDCPMEPEAFREWLFRCQGGSQTRPWHFLNWGRRLADTDGETFWGLLVEYWSIFDQIPHEEFAALFARFRGSTPRAGIPDKVTVYRGQDLTALPGLSWTTDREVAYSFARGHRGIKNPNPAIMTLEVAAAEIAFLCDNRQESEVVLFEISRKGDLKTL